MVYAGEIFQKREMWQLMTAVLGGATFFNHASSSVRNMGMQCILDSSGNRTLCPCSRSSIAVYLSAGLDVLSILWPAAVS